MNQNKIRVGDLLRFQHMPSGVYEVASVNPIVTKPHLKWRDKDFDHIDVYRKVNEAQKEAG